VGAVVDRRAQRPVGGAQAKQRVGERRLGRVEDRHVVQARDAVGLGAARPADFQVLKPR